MPPIWERKVVVHYFADVIHINRIRSSSNTLRERIARIFLTSQLLSAQATSPYKLQPSSHISTIRKRRQSYSMNHKLTHAALTQTIHLSRGSYFRPGTSISTPVCLLFFYFRRRNLKGDTDDADKKQADRRATSGSFGGKKKAKRSRTFP